MKQDAVKHEGEGQISQATMGRQERLAVAQKATWVSAWVNVLLTVVQLVVGWLAHSQSLIAHGLHSLSDLFSDFLVLYANHRGADPADEDHPYGHARYETAATLVLGVSLLGVGGGIVWDGVARLQNVGDLPAVGWWALWVALLTVAAKEFLYRYLIAVADRLRSKLLAANAQHTRADAASALVVVAGVGGALAGWPFLDVVAALLMGFMILKLGFDLGWGALRELMDEGLAKEAVTAIRGTLERVPGVHSVHELRTRRMAHQVLVDVHVQVAPRISVSEGHYIAESARAAVLRAHGQVCDVLVHIDPENDEDPVAECTALVRREIESMIQSVLPEGVGMSRLVLHYLKGRVAAEVWLEGGLSEDECVQAKESLSQLVAPHGSLAEMRVLRELAP